MDKDLKRKVKAVLQECYTADLANQKDREWVSDMLVEVISNKGNISELYNKAYDRPNPEAFKEGGLVEGNIKEAGGVSNQRQTLNDQRAFLAKIKLDNEEKLRLSRERIEKRLYRDSKLSKEARNEMKKKENETRKLASEPKTAPEIKAVNFFGEGTNAPTQTKKETPKQSPLEFVKKPKKPEVNPVKNTDEIQPGESDLKDINKQNTKKPPLKTAKPRKPMRNVSKNQKNVRGRTDNKPKLPTRKNRNK